MLKQSEDLINTITDAKTKAISLDIEIELDVLRYSGWWGALASGGLGVVLATWKATALTGQLHHQRAWLLSVTVPLICSVASGTYLYLRLNRSVACKRKQMALTLKQQIFLLADDDVRDVGRVLAEKALDLEYLPLKDLKRCNDLEDEDEETGGIQNLLVAQQLLAGIGYVCALLLVLVLA